MHCRLFFVFLLLFFSKHGLTASGAWDCEKIKGEEWSCMAQPGQPSVDKTTENKPLDSAVLTSPPKREVSLPVFPPVAAAKPQPVYVPPRTVAKRPGWTCTPNNENESWSCSLIGVDPKGQERFIGDSEYDAAWLTPAFDFKQEQVFETLQSQLKNDPWENCATSSRVQPEAEDEQGLRESAPMDVTADYSEVFDKEITSFFGNVEIVRADQKILSDMASYDTVSETMDAQGHVFYSENQLSMYSDTALLNLGSSEARLRKASFILPSGPIRGAAEVVYRDNKFLSRYKDVAFTSCRPGNQDWVLHADRLKMNKQTGKASAKHAWLEIKGLPVLYTPYISFPIDNRRTSGFLSPSWGNSDDNGFDVMAPYYWNIAPNYDLTIYPRYMTKRGGMIGGDFRYLTELTEGSLGLEFLPYDTLRKKQRYSGTFKNDTKFTSHLKSHIDLNFVSDDEYLDELSTSLDLAHNRHVRSRADLTYNTESIAFSTKLQTYQTIDKNIENEDKPYQKLPQVTLNLNHEFEQFPVDIALENEYSHFFHNSRISGHRFNTKPSISFPLETAGSFLIPKFSLQHTQYQLNNLDKVGGFNSKNISRTLPIFSADSGLIFEKSLNLFDSSYVHTLEPRLFYLYIPKKDQDDIPDFDTALYDFGFNSLFRENRFSGIDKIQDANQITVALTSRLLDSETGHERLKFSVGEIFYFKDREVTLQEGVTETESLSNLVAELNGQLTDHWSFSSGIQWNPDVNEFTRGKAEIQYRNRPDQIINLGYRYRRDDRSQPASIIQTDASIRWPIYDNWYGVARWQYSLKFNSTKDSFLGLEKESCCWRFRVIWRRYIDTLSDSSDNETEQGIFLQLELKGLASFGDKVDEFLEKNLKGYQRTE